MRIVGAALIANLAAPCLLLLSIVAQAVLLEPAEVIASGWADMLVASAIFLPMSWAGMAVTVFPLSLILAYACRAMGWRSWWMHAAAGAAAGLAFALWLVPLVVEASEIGRELYGAYLLIGAICGWIYWRIALGGRSEPGVL